MTEYRDEAIDASKFLVGVAVSLFMKMPHALQVLFWVMIADLISGIIASGIKKQLCSARGYVGAKKKTLMWIMLGVAHLANQTINFGVDFDSALAIYFIINEILSVAENCNRAGVKLPDWLETRLVAARDMDPGAGEHGKTKSQNA
jgi:toxin secretion/phage lysis holin